MGLAASPVPLAEAFDVVLLDLDGVVYRGHEPIMGAADGIHGVRLAGGHTVFVTNNSSREPASVADQLTAMGIPTSPGAIVTSAQAAAALLADRLPTGAAVLVVGGTGLRTAVVERGMTVVESAADHPAAVVQGFDAEVGWRQLAEASYAIADGSIWVATNLDTSLPTERGFAPGNGALVEAVAAATGSRPASVGKPESGIFRSAIERVGGGRGLVVGDRLETDIAGARNANLPALLVLTGVSTARDVILAGPPNRPTFIDVDLTGLLSSQVVPVEDGSAWRCRGASATVAAGTLTIEGPEMDPEGELSLDGLRAACAAAWSAADGGHPLDANLLPEFTIRRY